MKFVGIVGSNADQSYNRMLLQFIQRHFKVKFELELLEIKDVPMFNQDEDSLIVLQFNTFTTKSPVLTGSLLLPLSTIIPLLLPLRVLWNGSALICIHSKINQL